MVRNHRGRSRSSSPDPSTTTSTASGAPPPPRNERKASGRTKSPTGCFNKSKKPATQSAQNAQNDDTVPESDTSEAPTKSIACMRENLQNIIDNSLCDGPCKPHASEPACPAYSEQVHCSCVADSRRPSLAPLETIQCVTASRGSPASAPRCICNPTLCPVETAASKAPMKCSCDPALCPVETAASKAPMKCSCNPALCPVAPSAPFESHCDCNSAAQQPPAAEDCPCACAPGQDSTCHAKRSAFERFRGMFSRRASNDVPQCQPTTDKFYAFQQQQQGPLPRRLVFNLVDGSPTAPAPRPSVKAKGKPPGEKPERIVATPAKKYRMKEENKVEIYYFDHGNTGYYRTTDNPPPLITDMFLEKGEKYATRFWANIFGVLNIGLAFFIICFLQFIRFLAYGILRPLVVGLIQSLSDYFFKPLLSIIFNGIIQPICILLFNTATSISDICKPLATGIGYFLREIAHLCRAFRLVDVNNVHTSCSGPTKPEKCTNRRSSAGPCDVI